MSICLRRTCPKHDELALLEADARRVEPSETVGIDYLDVFDREHETTPELDRLFDIVEQTAGSFAIFS